MCLLATLFAPACSPCAPSLPPSPTSSVPRFETHTHLRSDDHTTLYSFNLSSCCEEPQRVVSRPGTSRHQLATVHSVVPPLLLRWDKRSSSKAYSIASVVNRTERRPQHNLQSQEELASQIYLQFEQPVFCERWTTDVGPAWLIVPKHRRRRRM